MEPECDKLIMSSLIRTILDFWMTKLPRLLSGSELQVISLLHPIWILFILRLVEVASIGNEIHWTMIMYNLLEKVSLSLFWQGQFVNCRFNCA